MPTLANTRLLFFVDDVYEDLELWYPLLRMREAGAEVVVAGPEAGAKYSGKHGYPCVADAAIRSMKADDFQGVVVPGGFMPDKLRRDAHVLDLVRRSMPLASWWPPFATVAGCRFRPAFTAGCV